MGNCLSVIVDSDATNLFTFSDLLSRAVKPYAAVVMAANEIAAATTREDEE
jgi:hypothetical protein